MKIIIQNDKISATATDDYIKLGHEQAVIDAPPGFEMARIGEYRYMNGGVEIPVEPTPVLSLVIDSITTEGVVEGTEVTLNVGSRVAVSGRILMGGKIVPVDASFRMPVMATDGRERLIGATAKAGIVTAAWTPKESGIWRITQALINRALPPEKRMSFLGLSVFAQED